MRGVCRFRISRNATPSTQYNLYTLAESTKATESNGMPPAAITQTVSLFDENLPISYIKPSDEELLRGDPNDDKILNVARRQVNYFAVDSEGNAYLLLWHRIIEYNSDGKLLWSVTTPEGFKGPFCVDDRGQLYILDKAGLEIYSTSNAPNLIVPASKLPYSEQAIVIKIVNDAAYKRLYIQTYDPVAVSQTLFSLDPTTGESKTIHQQRDQVKFTPSYAPGAFDFALGTDQIFVSDIYDYRVICLHQAPFRLQ
jgi:outer membrane protein assembly factor BamB